MPVIKIDKNDFDTQVLSGHLVKSPPLTKRGMRRWQKRYFVLRANRFLEYYKTPHSSIPKGVIDLRECVRMEVGLQFRKMRHILNVQTYHRLYYFNAPSEIEMRQWADLIYKVKEAMEGDVIDVSLNPNLIAPEIVTGTAGDTSIHASLSARSYDPIDHTLQTEMTRSRQYSRIILKRKEKPLDKRFLKKSIRYTGYYKQQAEKESSESESEDTKTTDSPEDSKITADALDSKTTDIPVVIPPTDTVISSSDNVMGLIQSEESLSSFFDIPAGSSNGSHELQSMSYDPIQQTTASEMSSGYESMDSPTLSSSSTLESTTTAATTNTTTTTTASTGGSRIKARKRTKPIPRPRQHRPAVGTMTQDNGSRTSKRRLLEGQTVTTTFNPQMLITCAAGIGCFGNDGGILTADNSKVTLSIPEGAIPLNANPYIIQYEVFTDHRPSVLPTHPISPLVHIKCSNTTFTSPITITIPHHIDNVDPSSCVVLATKQDLTTQSAVEFTAFPVVKANETSTEVTNNMKCILEGDHVSISTLPLQNYQWFMLAVNNEAIVRQCRVLVFHSRPKHGNFIIKISIVEDVTDAIQAAIQAETCDKKFSFDSDNITYKLKDWEGSSYVSLDELEFGFSLLEGVSTKTITLPGNRCWGSAEFTIKEMFNMPKTFTCDIVIDTNHLSHITNTVEMQPYIM